MRGGTRDLHSFHSSRRGLSPRARGNQSFHALVLETTRSIPACAGEPHVRILLNANRGVYPRVRGGTGDDGVITGFLEGLSPRARGNPRPALFDQTLDRSIPACAGEPHYELAAVEITKVYPRVRGGTPQPRRSQARAGGLSPRARGNLRCHIAMVGCLRSIPACAGEPHTKRGHPVPTPRAY